MRGYVATACGHDHILYFDGAKASDTILAYHRVTDTWFPMGQLPRTAVAAVGLEGTQFTLYAADVIFAGEALLAANKVWLARSCRAGLFSRPVGWWGSISLRKRSPVAITFVADSAFCGLLA